MSLRVRAVRSALGGLALVIGLTGCSVATRVTLTVDSSGRGSVVVTVNMDRAALDAVGGLARLQSELAVGDLEAAGWSVTGPIAPGTRAHATAANQAGAGGAVITVSHGFSGLAQAQSLVSEVAGPGVFQVQLASHHGFWHTTFHLTGAVDLTCGINCFGDAGLRTATGSPVGVDPGALAARTGQTPARVFTFQFDGRLPGHVHAGPGGTTGSGGSVLWAPVLGQKAVLSASSQSVNRSAVEEVSGAAGVVLLVVASFTLWRVGRWARRRLPARHTPQHRKHGTGDRVEGSPVPAPSPSPDKAVTPPS